MERITTYYLFDKWAIWTVTETIEQPLTVPIEWIPDEDDE